MRKPCGKSVNRILVVSSRHFHSCRECTVACPEFTPTMTLATSPPLPMLYVSLRMQLCCGSALYNRERSSFLHPLPQSLRMVFRFMGSEQGMMLSSLPPNADGNNVLGSRMYNGRRTLAKAYVRAGDICLKYKDDTLGLPHTRVRCLSQMFRWFTDENNFLSCMGYKPSLVGAWLPLHSGCCLSSALAGGWVMDYLITPILGLLPSKIQENLGPVARDLIGSKANKYLDEWLAKGPPPLQWFWSWSIGKVYVHLTQYLAQFFAQLNVRNFINLKEPT